MDNSHEAKYFPRAPEWEAVKTVFDGTNPRLVVDRPVNHYRLYWCHPDDLSNARGGRTSDSFAHAKPVPVSEIAKRSISNDRANQPSNLPPLASTVELAYSHYSTLGLFHSLSLGISPGFLYESFPANTYGGQKCPANCT